MYKEATSTSNVVILSRSSPPRQTISQYLHTHTHTPSRLSTTEATMQLSTLITAFASLAAVTPALAQCNNRVTTFSMECGSDNSCSTRLLAQGDPPANPCPNARSMEWRVVRNMCGSSGICQFGVWPPMIHEPEWLLTCLAPLGLLLLNTVAGGLVCGSGSRPTERLSCGVELTTNSQLNFQLLYLFIRISTPFERRVQDGLVELLP